jgi:uncharacterized protein DUF6519/parallel beta helix pectate lyase-like protein
MSADLSRQRFNPLNNLSGVLMQQGRVQLDADWNEFVEILDRRFRAETSDIIGRCVVPRERPESFEITIAGTGTDLNIGPGRIYVDGLLAENHGDATAIFDEVLGELRGKNPVLYTTQPYFPSAKLSDLAQTLPLLVYIDVWEREVTFIEDPELVEKAVGVDTTARVQTVWQVKVLPIVGAGATCTGNIHGWNDLIAPSAGRLSTDAQGVPSTKDPCLIPPTGGYLGLENQLYRVEIHDVDAVGNATFKWSRENASVATNITSIDTTGTVLTVDSVGRDSVLCFTAGNWIEITDDVRELAGQAGVMRKVLLVGEKTITLAQPLTATATVNEVPDTTRNARIRRWDQSGTVVDTSGGVIPVPAAGTPVLLENGVEVKFSLDPNIANGKFHIGDYWVFAARFADASVEELKDAAPRGIHHHYGRLAIVTSFSAKPTDCRIFWPPEEEKGCDCSVCVTAESHKNGTLTIQQAIDQVKDVGGTVCLGPGFYEISDAKPVRIDGARSIRLKGQSWYTVLWSTTVPGVVISNSLRATVEDLSVAVVGPLPGFAVGIVNSVAVTLQRCAIVQWNTSSVGAAAVRGSGAAIKLSGFLIDTRIRDNAIYGWDGISGTTPGQQTANTAQPVNQSATNAARAAGETGAVGAPTRSLSALLRIDDNFIFAPATGVGFDAGFFYVAENRIVGNYIAGCRGAGIETRGLVAPGKSVAARLDIHGNVVSTSGHGIVISTNETRITDNDISASITLDQAQSRSTSLNAGILLTAGEIGRIDHCQILENRINGMGGLGIGIAANIASAMIKQNIIDGAGLGGIVMEGVASADVLTIENNQISNVAAGFNGQGAPLLIGIAVINTQQATIAGNTVIGVGLAANSTPAIIGIAVVDSISARIVGNMVYDIAPASAPAGGRFFFRVGIYVLSAIDRLDILNNDVNRNRASASKRANDMTVWGSLFIQEKFPDAPIGQGQTITTQLNRFTFANGMIWQLPRGPETIAVRGNVFEGYGTRTPIVITSKGACLFGDNRCNFVPAANGVMPIAEITAEAIIANANFFQTSPNDKTVLLKPGNGPITVLGNIASGPIWINTATLHNTPWANLNIPTS